MTSAVAKEKLHEYIERADDKKVQAIYTLLENDIEGRSYLYDKAVLQELRETSAAYHSGKMKGTEVAQSMQSVRKQLGKK